jgi:tetratricopeptide (TPR) repeat protein
MTMTTGVTDRRGVLVLAGIVALSVGLYLQVAGGPVLTSETGSLDFLASASPGAALAFQEEPDQARPLSNLLRYALVTTSGTPASLRVAAALLHGINALLVFFIVSSLIRRGEGSGADAPGVGATILAPVAAALLFAVHPLASEALLSHGAFDIVAGTGFALACLLLAAARGGGEVIGSFAPGALFLASLLCYGGMWPVALAAAALGARPAGSGGRARVPLLAWSRELAPYATALVLFYVCWAARNWPDLSFGPTQREWPVVQGLASQGAALIDALRLLVLPVGLSVDQGRAAYLGDWNLQAVTGTLLMALLVGGSFVAARRGGLAGLALGWLGFLQLHLILAPPVNPLEERRLYPLILTVAILGAVAVRAMERRAGVMPAAAAAAVVCILLMLGAASRARLWMDPAELWSSAAESNPSSARGFIALGNVFMDRGETEKALQSYEGALARAPRSASIQNSVAEAYFAKGDYHQSLQEANKAMELDPAFLPAYLTAGNSFMMRGQTRDAFLSFNAALLVNPDDPAALYNMGVLHYREKQYVKATRLLERAAELRPADAEIWFRLGLSRFFEGDYARSSAALRTCLDLDSDRLDARVNLAGAMTKTGEHEGAGVVLQSVLDMDPDNADAMNGLAILATARNDREAARSWFEQAVEADPDNLQFLFNLAGAYEELGELDKAVDSYREFVDRWTGSLELGETVREKLEALEARQAQARRAS